MSSTLDRSRPMSQPLGEQAQRPGWPDSRLTVRMVDRDGASVALEVIGECDLASADLLAGVLADHVQAGRRLVRLDLSGMTFVDATGLGVLIAVDRQLRKRGGRLLLRHVGRRFERLLAITRLDGVLTVVPDPDAPAR